MKTAKPAAKTPPTGILFIVLLVVILAALFSKSFLPDYVLFSNDGPLGQNNAKWLQLPAAYTGCWDDLNDIGNNAGAWPPDWTALSFWMLGTVGYAKFFVPITLFVLGFSAWCFFRQLNFSPAAAALGGLAAALNSAFFATACWGVAGQLIAFSMDFLALALVVSISPATPPLTRWMRLALAGLAVGVNVMEAFDIGAIFSLFVAAFVLFKALTDESGPGWLKWGRGVGQIAVIAIFAGFIATQSIVVLVGSQITGIAGTGQDTETKAQHWDPATQWSVPKIETLGLFIPGLFGYRMDTPKNMMDFSQDAYKGGNYWGGVGRDPAIDRFLASGKEGSPPPGFMRFSGHDNYAGVLVMLVALWAVAQSLRRQNPAFAETQRRFIWFWSVILIVSLLLAFGRFAPFYKWLYMLPYVSTMRNPCKFIAVFSWALVILFAYGIHGLSRRYLEISAANSISPLAQLKNWWMKARGFDRNWTLVSVLAVIGSVLGWLIYAMEKPGLVRYLQVRGFPDEDMAKEIAAFSVGQVGWFIIIFALAVGLCTLVIAGIFAGRRAKLGAILLGTLLVMDLGRGNLPYIIHWDYKQKYDIDSANPTNSTNPIINFLRAKPYEYRVADLPFDTQQRLKFYDNYFGGNGLYRIEWAQHHFPYYNIQSLDKIQMPRMPADLEAYEMALMPRSENTYSLMARRWELTNTRYLLGVAGFLGILNEQLDPVQHRFRIAQRFDVIPKPGITQPTGLEELTAMPSDDGDLALIEFTGALPRARLYSNWQVSTNDTATLQTLTNTNFDPWQTVLVSTPLPTAPAADATIQNVGSVEFKRYVPDDPVFGGKRNGLWKQSGYCYAPKDIMFDAQANTPAVLLLNDRFDPHWRVLVDGKPAELLRCNFIMRGVYLASGAHTVEFQFKLPNGPLNVSLTAIAAGLFLCGCLWLAGRRARPDPKPWKAAPPIATNKPAGNDLKH
jgi:hypothetical protein